MTLDAVRRTVIVLLSLSTLNALRILYFDGELFVRYFPGANPSMGVLYTVTSILILGGLIGLWRMQPWSLAALALATVATLALDEMARAPAFHKGLAAASFVLLVALSRQLWPGWARR